MVTTRVVGTLLVLALSAGCGEVADDNRIEITSAVASPYDGPLNVELDYSDNATVLESSGAAGQALECEFDPYRGGGGDYDSGLESVQDDPQQAFANFLEQMFAPTFPLDEFVVEAHRDSRVLLSLDVDGRTRAAVVAADEMTDWRDNTGWGVEAWAMCDPAEFPDGVLDGAWEQVWEDAQGDRVPTSEVVSFQGAEHCSWEDIVFLSLGDYGTGEVYLRDVRGVFASDLRSTFQASSGLPSDATNTGYRRDGRELWTVPSHDAAYLVSLEDPDDVERWPAPKHAPMCE
jgi:hypothetical protein